MLEQWNVIVIILRKSDKMELSKSTDSPTKKIKLDINGMMLLVLKTDYIESQKGRSLMLKSYNLAHKFFF